ncbi:unnamed protein product [Cunninghamella blakesleeana]
MHHLKNNIYIKSTSELKQINLSQYFKTILKKRNMILDYFKPKEEKAKEKKKLFDLLLVDIKESWEKWNIKSIKKNMCDYELKYIATSYRWGEVQEQLLKTPDYTAYITSFYLNGLC